MAQKIKLTKGELKRRRDTLKQFERYLPTLQLKKQQLQMEILHLQQAAEDKRRAEKKKTASFLRWGQVLAEPDVPLADWIKPAGVQTGSRNIAGIDIPVFSQVSFETATYDLFVTPLWAESAVESVQAIFSMRKEQEVIDEGIAILRDALRTTTQRVNLFEKVKIPEAKEAIRVIKIAVGDQMTNAVVRSKIAKRKSSEQQEQLQEAGVLV